MQSMKEKVKSQSVENEVELASQVLGHSRVLKE